MFDFIENKLYVQNKRIYKSIVKTAKFYPFKNTNIFHKLTSIFFEPF